MSYGHLVIFLRTYLITNNVIQTYYSSSTFGIFYILCHEMLSWILEIWMKYNLAMTIIATLEIYNAQIMLGLHLVLVTLHERFTISIKQDKYNW